MKPSIFTAFTNPSYRLYFFGQFTSLIGNWTQQTAISWIVFSQTQSTTLLGLTLFAGQFPTFLFSLAGGNLSDRIDRFKIVMVCQVSLFMLSSILAALAIFGVCKIWTIILITFCSAIIYAFDIPARNSLVYDLFNDKKKIPNALALNSLFINLSRVIGPALAGFILQCWGYPICFLFNSFSYLAILRALFFMKFPPKENVHPDFSTAPGVLSGITYVKNTPQIKQVLIFIIFMDLTVVPFVSLMPAFVKDTLHGSAPLFGCIEGSIGFGAIISAFCLASLPEKSNRSKILALNAAFLGGGLMLLSCSHRIFIANVFAAFSGFALMAQATLVNTIIQTTVNPTMRGRVISYVIMAYYGFVPAGTLLMGCISDKLGVSHAFLFGGFAAFFGLLYLRYSIDNIKKSQGTKIHTVERRRQETQSH